MRNWKFGSVVIFIALAILALLPTQSPPQYVMSMLTSGLVLVMLTCSWDFLAGSTGQVSFGHAAFFGMGGYGAILSIVHLGFTPWAALIFGVIMASMLGLVVGMICLRLRGPYLALVTLALAQILALLVDMTPSFTRGELGISGYDGLVSSVSGVSYYYIALVLAVAVVVCTKWLMLSKYGLILRTIKEDEIKAECVGVPTVKYKIFAFIISSGIAGLAGAFYAFFVHVLTPGVFDTRFSALPIGMAILGGVGTIIGPALFALLFHMIGEALRPLGAGYDLFLLGVVIAVAVMYLPKGLYPLLWRVKSQGKPAPDIAVKAAHATQGAASEK